jgi:hypothetical protein
MGAFIVVPRGGWRGVIRWSLLQTCRRRRNHLPHLDNGVIGWSLLLARGGRSSAVVARASYLLHARGRRSDAAVGTADLLDTWGRRSIVLARERSEPPITVSSLLLRKLRMLHANHGWPNVKKTTIFIWLTDLAILICTKHFNICNNHI